VIVLVPTAPRLAREGGRLPVPTWDFSLETQYQRPIGTDLDLDVILGITGTGPTYSGATQIRRDAYYEVNLSASLARGPWRFTAYGLNITNERHLESFSDGVFFRGGNPAATSVALTAPPARFGVKIELSF
jgi:hypothetical protein